MKVHTYKIIHRGDGLWMYQTRMLGGDLHSKFMLGVNEFIHVAFAHTIGQEKESRTTNLTPLSPCL